MSNLECSIEFQIKGVGIREEPKHFQHKSCVNKVDLQQIIQQRRSVEEDGHRRLWKEGDKGWTKAKFLEAGQDAGSEGGEKGNGALTFIPVDRRQVHPAWCAPHTFTPGCWRPQPKALESPRGMLERDLGSWGLGPSALLMIWDEGSSPLKGGLLYDEQMSP